MFYKDIYGNEAIREYIEWQKSVNKNDKTRHRAAHLLEVIIEDEPSAMGAMKVYIETIENGYIEPFGVRANAIDIYYNLFR